MAIKQIRSYNTDCTGDVCVGDEILFTEAVFEGNFKNPYYVGDRRVAGTVVADSYGSITGQHTFSILVVGSDGHDPIEKGKKIRRKGRNVYRNGTKRRPRDEDVRQKILEGKHRRGDSARAKKYGTLPFYTS